MAYNRLFNIDPWKLTTHQLDKEHRRLQESLTSIGNGYMGMRGNFEESYSGDSHRGTYIAGVWFPDKTRVGWWKNGYPLYFGKVINALNFIAIDIDIDGIRVDLHNDEIKDFYLELDMHSGILSRRFTLIRGSKEIIFHFKRFLSLKTKELCAIEMNITTNQQANITVYSILDGNVFNEDSNYDETFWQPVFSAQNQLVLKTKENSFDVEQFTVAALMTNKVKQLTFQKHHISDMKVSEIFSGQLAPNQTATMEKRVVITTSRDYAEENLIGAAQNIFCSDIDNKSYSEIEQEHSAQWAKRWEMADVIIDGDVEAQQGIRFNLFQLFSTYYGEDERLNIGPKGFTGEKYGGATYWDTEAYAVPLYLALTDPKVTKNLLKYRYNQLNGAFHNAKQQGLKGALYPMVTFTGVECHNEWEITFEEIHRNGAIAYAIYKYTRYTGDTHYLENEGLDVLTAISRFWADRVHYSKRQQKYMIHGVTGPNEYENNVNNNWYTNTLAVWVLKYTSETLSCFPDRQKELAVSADELSKWQDIIDHMYLPYDEEKGIFIQHDTFLDKDLMFASELAKHDRPLNQKWSWDKILRSCFIKQADVLQGIYFFGEQFTPEEKRRNFEFYEPMTVHESSLSPCVHSILAAELKKTDAAVAMYQRTARLDLDNYNNDTEDGLHITSMTGSWLAIVEGFAGMRTHDGLTFSPFLPECWQGYQFRINYRERLINVSVSDQETKITLLSGAPLLITLYETAYQLDSELIVATER